MRIQSWTFKELVVFILLCAIVVAAARCAALYILQKAMWHLKRDVTVLFESFALRAFFFFIFQKYTITAKKK